MKPLFSFAFCLLLAFSTSSFAAYDISPDSVHRHIEVLASDSLEGREVGEPGELKAARYMIKVLQAAGLKPLGDSGSFLQAFDFIKRISPGENNRLSVNGKDLVLKDDFTPLFYSADTVFDFSEIVDVNYGIITDDSAHNDYADLNVDGKAVLVKRYAPEAEETDDTTETGDTIFDRHSSLTSKIITALDHGASGVFFWTPPEHDDTLLSTGATRVTPKSIPIVFLRRAGIEKLGLDLTSPEIMTASGQTDLERVRDTGYNVVGFLQGATDTTVIIGAHYDHLGWGGPSSRYLEDEKKIHYGADDNGSGVAALLELARYAATRGDELRHSMLFIGFGGEEAGLLGSSHYVRNWTIDRTHARMMINMDMIGRLKDQDKGLAILGTGTCPDFKEYFDSMDVGDLKVVFKESGTGPSDHAAFYNDSIPVLNFFTGAHEDYHKPSDVTEKIDFEGVVSVANLIGDIVQHFDDYPDQLVFQRTKDDGPGRHSRAYSVTLGVMPDFISEVEGLRIDGVSPGRPADNAGLLKGDIVIKMGDIAVDDIYTYMNALSKFRKGDTTPVSVVRGEDTLSVTVEFK
ncbi:MAG: M28 family peptidase [bacterium]|nr:M28 family peptidase [bacterium]